MVFFADGIGIKYADNTSVDGMTCVDLNNISRYTSPIDFLQCGCSWKPRDLHGVGHGQFFCINRVFLHAIFQASWRCPVSMN